MLSTLCKDLLADLTCNEIKRHDIFLFFANFSETNLSKSYSKRFILVNYDKLMVELVFSLYS